MPPKGSTTTTGDGPKLTESELRVLGLAWQCFKTMPQVDTAKLAELGGYKTAASANAVFCSAKKKLLGDVKLPPAEKAPPKKAAAAKLAAAATATADEDDDDDENEEAVETPPAPALAKKAKAGPGRKRKAVVFETAAEDGEEEKATPQPQPQPPVNKKAKATTRGGKKKIELKDATAAEEEAAVVKSEKVDEVLGAGDAAGDVAMKGAEEEIAIAEGEGEVEASIETGEEDEETAGVV